eukprot:CAMPEP_0198259478 /NCGR_PEP_ID=MMETSP1447-20131203/8658_1 /TAXON_ID=420782 /ORGANISM="Chaetoceros dichaeta, Strain CCMP1751" /LENGTH=501 /DNA_ID=CAMNT_0043946873 /DNA_START=40 /DNA_END=1545 /DNA_ORIENTATION=-
MTNETMTKKTPSTSTKQHQPFEYEFGGPIGAFLTTLLLPPLTLLLTHAASTGKLTSLLDTDFLLHHLSSAVGSSISGGSSSFSSSRLVPCLIATLAWFLFQVLLQKVLPCELVQGAPLPRNDNDTSAGVGGGGKGDCKRITYRINGHLGFWVTLLLLGFGWPYWKFIDEASSAAAAAAGGDGWWTLQFGCAPLHLLYDYYTELATASIIWCTLLSIYLYARTHTHRSSTETTTTSPLLLAKGGQSGNHIYDFFIGRELNPTWGPNHTGFEWKEFCELRPGLILWVVLNLAFLSVQHSNLGYVSSSMLLVNAFQFFYVWDALYQERAILTTMDITTDGFGFMLVFGDMVWVPFTYSLQARYLVDHDPGMGWVGITVILLVNMVGYGIFRGANSQKDAFRRDPSHPSVSHLKYHPTERGTRLLISGWWGLARKVNYTGDWIMGLSWCLVCGFGSVVPYYYAVYFAILLVHRSERDEHMCREKYGADWGRYKELVPYRFIPGVL